MSHQEIELKRLLVGEAAGERLAAALGQTGSVPRSQVNHLLDTATFALRTAKHTLRLREEEGRWSLTAKGQSHGIGTFTSCRVEAEMQLASSIATEILAAQRDPIAELRRHFAEEATYAALFCELERARAGEQLIAQGSFQNWRRRVPVKLPGGLELVLEIDRTSFPDGVSEHEVEVEIPEQRRASEVEAWLTFTLESAGIASRPSRSKTARFYEHGGGR